MQDSAARQDAKQALMDAAERLLVEVGHAGISTRRLAEEAGVNHGLVHYYFGSVENLLAEMLERFTQGLIERQRAMYAADVPFIEKWRTAMNFMDIDRKSGYQKIWLELHALAWNNPDLRARVARVTGEWRAVVREAIENAAREYGHDPDQVPVAALTALVETFTMGSILERHVGVTEGHRELLDEVERLLELLEKGKRNASSAARRRRVRRT